LKWKILIPIVIITVVAVLFLIQYFQLSINATLILSSFTIASPFIILALNQTLNHYQKSKINLKIENAHFLETKINDSSNGYKLRVEVVNIGKKIFLNPTVTFSIKDKQGKEATLLQADYESDDGHKTTKITGDNVKAKYSWHKISDQPFDGKELRQNDRFYILFPREMEQGPCWGFGDAGGRIKVHGFSVDRFIRLIDDKYKVEVELKGEDLEKITYTKKQTFNISIKKST
jgi:hypothetical protein